MTKKFLSVLLCCALFFAATVTAGASSASPSTKEGEVVSEKVILTDDGCLIETIRIYPNNTKTARSGNFADKSYNYRTSSGLEWCYTISGYFSWNGVSATASNPSDSYDIFFDDWSCTSHSVRAAGPTIVGNATFKCFGLTKITKPTLTCSANGNFT